MKKVKTLDAFFKRKSSDTCDVTQPVNEDSPSIEVNTSKCPRLETKDCQSLSFDIDNLERDPGLRPQIWDYPINLRDEVIRAYLEKGPYQIHLSEYPLSTEKHPRRFQFSWFKKFPWLEYSPAKDAAYCFPCFLFSKPVVRHGTDAFTVKGFTNWKKVNDGKRCAFLNHVGQDPCSPHNNAKKCCQDLLNQSQHIDKVINAHSLEQKEENRLRVKTSIDVVRWLASQGCAFRGHDETSDSSNRGNFLELVSLLASYNEKVSSIVMENAPKNAKYTSHMIQKEILHILANKVRQKIRHDIGDSKFCIIIDEARDESKREQMAIVLRYFDDKGFIRERFFDLVHVKDTSAVTLKKEICSVLSRHCLDVQNIRGQGYDGASNMRGEWNGLQALFLDDCPYAYYVHCLAHRLQLALVAASREVIPIHNFFSDLTFIVNIVGASCKRHDQLQVAQAIEIENMLAIGELETGRGLNQIGTVKRAGETRWSSHFSSVCSLITMFAATCSVLEDVIESGSSYSIRGDAAAAYKMITSFDFVFTLHLVKEIMGITDILCQHLQQKSQDIVNAMHLVLSTKTLIQKLRDDGWDNLLESVKAFCEKHSIEVPDMQSSYVVKRGRHRHDGFDMQHHYRVDIFNAAIDSQLLELNSRFNEQAMDLLTLSSALDPKDAYSSFNIDDICCLVEKYYPLDFTEQEKINLKFQLQHYKLNVLNHPKLQNLSTISDLCQKLAETQMSKVYFLVDRLIRLILTLPVSTATTERAFSAMKIVKTRLRNKMEDEFLADNLVVHIEREIAETFDSDSVLADFISLKERRAQF